MDDRLVRELLTDHSRNPRNYGSLSDPDVERGADTPPVVEAVRFTTPIATDR